MDTVLLFFTGGMGGGSTMGSGQILSTTTTVAQSSSQQNATKEPPNTATICRIGQETVQEIVTRYVFNKCQPVLKAKLCYRNSKNI
jgi:hypothetical protein